RLRPGHRRSLVRHRRAWQAGGCPRRRTGAHDQEESGEMTTVEELHEISIPSAREEPAAYLRALLELAEDRDALETLATTPVTVRQLCASLSMAQLQQRPADEEWAAADIVGHLFD